MYILIPVKNTSQAKSRLADLLSPNQRRALTLALLCDVLTALTNSGEINSTGALIHIISDDPLVRDIASAFSVVFIEDLRPSGLNAALGNATHRLKDQGAKSLLILPADLPRISSDDVDALLSQHGGAPSVTIAPAERDLGTNALGISPPGLIDFSFGPESFERHCAAARAQGAKLSIIRRPGLAFDLDTPEDLFAFADDKLPTVAGKLISSWSLETKSEHPGGEKCIES